MKFIKFFVLFLLSSCVSTQISNVNMESKGLIKVSMSVVDSDTRTKVKASKLYFVELQSRDDYKSKRVIVSDKTDSGYICANLNPGIYAVVAAQRVLDGYFVYTFFDQDLISRTVVQLEKGKTETINIQVLDYLDSMFDRTPESAKYYKAMLYTSRNEITYPKIGKYMPTIEEMRKAEHKKIDQEKKERDGIIIEQQ